MTDRRAITRRDFLRAIILFGAFCPFVLTRPLSAANSNGSIDNLVDQLTNILRNRESVRVVGEEYLKIMPAEDDRYRLVELIFSQEQYASFEVVGKETPLKNVVIRQRRDDFESGRTVKINGWILSRTEARICALIAISPNAGASVV